MLASTHLNKFAAKGPSTPVLVAYFVIFACITMVYHFVAEGEFSSVLTMAVMFQCFAVVLLAMQVVATGSAAGVSARSLQLEAVALVCRLSSTLWLNGYLPVDATGDHIYQIVDICSVGMVLWLVHSIFTAYRSSYQEAEDSMPVVPMVLGSFVFGALFHSDMNSRPVFDALWMAGLLIGVVAVLPQLWLITRAGGKVQALTSHYIAAMAVSRVLSGSFMWHARFDITCEPWVDGYEHAIFVILAAHALHMILLGDFAYYYVKSIAAKGLGCNFELQGDFAV
jgi:hypothetical protein